MSFTSERYRMNVLTTLRILRSWLYARYVAPARLAKRRSHRLAIHEFSDTHKIPTASLALEHSQPDAALSCAVFVAKYAGHYRDKQQVSIPVQARSSKLKPLLTALDLRHYATHQDYVKAIRKQSGYFLRNAKKASKQGFTVRAFVEAEYVAAMLEIIGSKPSSLLHVKQSTQAPLGDSCGLCASKVCTQHWEQLFGVFSGEAHPTLVAYARLRRFGNIVSIQDFIGHQSHLESGVMKLLFSEIMRWLIDSADPQTIKIDFVGFGTLESANDGLFFWKKKALFTPWIVALQQPPLPEGWDAKRYLQLNPDVAAAGADAVAHYLSHGKFEQRAY